MDRKNNTSGNDRGSRGKGRGGGQGEKTRDQGRETRDQGRDRDQGEETTGRGRGTGDQGRGRGQGEETTGRGRGTRDQGRGRGQGRGDQGRGGPSEVNRPTVPPTSGQHPQPPPRQPPQTQQLQGAWAKPLKKPPTTPAPKPPAPPTSQEASGTAGGGTTRQGRGAVSKTAQGAVPKTSQGAVPKTSQGAVPKTTQRDVPETTQGADAPITTQTSSEVRGSGGRPRINQPAIRTRPESIVSKQGTKGAAIALKTNHLFLRHSKDVNLYQYRVDFVPDLDFTALKKALFRTAFASAVPVYLFDGTVLYTTVYSDGPLERVVDSNRGERFQITMRLVGNLAWGDYQYIPVLNIIIRKCLNLMNYELIRREYYDKTNPDEFRFGNKRFTVWPGIFTSTRQCETNILLNIDLRFKVTNGDTALSLFKDCTRNGQQYGRQMFRNQIIGMVVMTEYNDNKTYKVDDVDFDSTAQSEFPKADGTTISYVDYYRTRYCKVIEEPTIPFMLVSRASRREIRGGMSEVVKLVPELCLLTGLTDQQRENFQLMRGLATITRPSAPERVRKLTEFARRVNDNAAVTAEIGRWNVDIANSLLQLQGRQLPCERVHGGGASYSAGPKADWGREVRRMQMFRHNDTKIAVITPQRNARETREFMPSLARAAAGMNWNLGNYRVYEIGNDSAGSYINQIDSLARPNGPNVFLIVLAKNSLDRYGAVKKKCTCDRGVLSQIVLAKQLTHRNAMSIATNIAIQINAKNLGAPWTVPIPLTDLMVVGYDVCRDTALKAKSFAAMVASMDLNISQYYSAVYEHRNEEELSNCIGQSLEIACVQYKKNRGNYPQRIILYRDGVGDGQLEYVRDHEVAQVVKKLTGLYGQRPLKMAYIVVSKRINVKFFTMDNQNPPPGTIVDNVVTQPERYDFYLSSQCVNQGTVSPTSYNVIYDTTGLVADHLQQLTNKLCHLYYNWSGTIKVPAPVQYAHKLAFQTSQALHRPCHPNLQHLLHFL